MRISKCLNIIYFLVFWRPYMQNLGFLYLSYNCPIWLSYICLIIVLWLSYNCISLALHMLRTFLSPLTYMTSITWQPRAIEAHPLWQCMSACWMRRLRMPTTTQTKLGGVFEIRPLFSVASRRCVVPAENFYTAVCRGPWLSFLARLHFVGAWPKCLRVLLHPSACRSSR